MDPKCGQVLATAELVEDGATVAVIVVFFTQRTFIQGITLTGIKG